MTKSRILYILAIIAIVVAAACYLAWPRAKVARAAAQPIQVRWLISHQPVDVFARAEKIFADELSRESNGTMQLVVVTPEQVGLPAKGDVSESKIEQLLQDKTVDLASPYTVPLGTADPAFWGLNLPFLFDSYVQAQSVLEGDRGTRMLDGLAVKSHMRGLAFTMSGGFRVIASKNTKIASAEDLKGKRIGTSGGPVAEATLTSLGAVPVPLDLETAPPDLATLDGVETTYARLSEVVGSNSEYTKYVNETDHSMFLTALVSSDSFYESLTAHQQAALEKAALAAARAEREDSIALNDGTKLRLQKSGSTVTVLSAAQRSALKAMTQSVYAQFKDAASAVQ